MSIGKSAIKRVGNNGYSNIQSSAPYMTNSLVISNISNEVEEKMIAPIEEKTTEKKNASQVKKTASVKKKNVSQNKKNGFITISCGEDLPYYLL